MGGNFAIPAYRLLDLSKKSKELRVINLLEKILSRKSNSTTTLEEHYAERTWAGLLSQPLTNDEVESLYNISGGEYIWINGSIIGRLKTLAEYRKKFCSAEYSKKFVDNISKIKDQQQ